MRKNEGSVTLQKVLVLEIYQFSTAVELASENVCLSVSHLNTLGQAGDFKKWSDLAEILHTCSLGESLGCFFIFSKF